MKVGLFINTQFPEGVNLAERASPLANDAETKKPRWGDRGFARTDDPDRGNPWGGMIVLASKRSGCGYDSAENRDRLRHPLLSPS